MTDLGFIAVAGMIGVGKTTLAENLAKALKAPLIREEYGQNPFLSQQLAGDHDAALLSELFFLLSRARQLDQNALRHTPNVVADYLFNKNRLFAEMFLENQQLQIFQQVEKIVLDRIATPNLLIYLHDTPKNCLSRITQRGRDFEKTISAHWLTQLGHAYDALIDNWTHCPVIKLDCAQHDFRQPETVKTLLKRLRTEFTTTTTPQTERPNRRLATHDKKTTAL